MSKPPGLSGQNSAEPADGGDMIGESSSPIGQTSEPLAGPSTSAPRSASESQATTTDEVQRASDHGEGANTDSPQPVRKRDASSSPNPEREQSRIDSGATPQPDDAVTTQPEEDHPEALLKAILNELRGAGSLITALGKFLTSLEDKSSDGEMYGKTGTGESKLKVACHHLESC
jgi:hypothetical protein